MWSAIVSIVLVLCFTSIILCGIGCLTKVVSIYLKSSKLTSDKISSLKD